MAAMQPAGTDPAAPPKNRHNLWIWVSAVLAVAVVGLLVWGISTRSDLDNAEQDVDRLQSELDKQQQAGGTVAAAVKTAFDALASQVGAASEDLTAIEDDLRQAKETGEQAAKDAAAAADEAAGASDEADRLRAEADQAQAATQEAKSRATIAGDCAKAYVSAFGTLLEGDDVRAQAASVRGQLEGITADCRVALSGG
jgi:septal ring factor EnvC (AmiA/AmiB activator)